MEGDGETVFRHACRLGLEGIVSNRKDSAYRSGRSRDWLKNADAPAVKRVQQQDAVTECLDTADSAQPSPSAAKKLKNHAAVLPRQREDRLG
jgi:hypothetical protein